MTVDRALRAALGAVLAPGSCGSRTTWRSTTSAAAARSPCEETFAVDEGHEEHGAALSLTLRDALAELPEEQREVIVLRHVAGWSPGEIAEHLGKSEDSIHGLHHRGRRALQQELVARDAAPVAASA